MTTTAPFDLDELLEEHAEAHVEYSTSEDGSPFEARAKQRREDAAAVIRKQFAQIEADRDERLTLRESSDLAKMVDAARAALRDADAWIERVGMAAEAVIILAEDKTPGLALLADLALWNDRRRELLAAVTPTPTDAS